MRGRAINLLAAAIAYYLLQQAIFRAEGDVGVLRRALGRDLKGKLSPVLYVAGIVATLNAPDVRPKLLEQGFEIVANTPEQFTSFQAAEFERWKKVITERKITAD